MMNYLPLCVEQYDGSVFSYKYHSSSILAKDSMYLSNYPKVNFTFRSTNSDPILAERVSIISNSKKIQNSYAVKTGLIFSTNSISWFHVAKEYFGKFQKEDYEKWVSQKKSVSDHRAEWEPVAFVDIVNKT